MFTPWFPEELGRPDDFYVRRRGGGAAGTSSRPEAEALNSQREARSERTRKTRRNVVRRREGRPKHRRMSIRSRSILKVPWNEGNSTPEDPLEGSEMPGHGAEHGQHE